MMTNVVPPSAPPPAAARYDVGGRPLLVRLVPEQATFMAGEPTFATLTFSAPEGGIEIEAAWMGRNKLGRPENYRIEFVDAKGVVLPVPEVGISFGGMSHVAKLGAGREHRDRLLLPLWIGSLGPGRYTVRCTTKLPARPDTGSDAGAAWQTVEVSVETSVEVIADDATAIGALLEKLGARAIGGDHDAASEAMRKLALVRDPRVVAEWIRVARVRDYEHVFAATMALGAWDDDRALAEIERVGATRAEDLDAQRYANEELRVRSAAQLRVAAAQALSVSPHRRASAALLAMKSDADASVRLTVLHHAAKVADARTLLESFAKDPDATVRNEAKRYLAERRR
ncbi:Hypothetical protein A7982_09925 [Minicystis rosea]|nr:Hypothetical protein A7982_09925 [Minicystis rosea]